MLSIVVWKWGTLYSADYINNLQSMLVRYLHVPHQLFCITDDPAGITSLVICFPMPEETFAGMSSPSGKRSNFRRLRTFDKEFHPAFGNRIVLMDIDVVITGDITPLFSHPERLVCYDQRHNDGRLVKHNTSVVLFDRGVLHHMWQEFSQDPVGVWGRVTESKVGDGNNSDQAVFGFYARDLDPLPALWQNDEGITAFYRVRNNDAGLPPDTRMVLFFGGDKPTDEEWQRKCPWILEHWKGGY